MSKHVSVEKLGFNPVEFDGIGMQADPNPAQPIPQTASGECCPPFKFAMFYSANGANYHRPEQRHWSAIFQMASGKCYQSFKCAKIYSANGANYYSPGQRPGSHLDCFTHLPRALPWAVMGRAFGAEKQGAGL